VGRVPCQRCSAIGGARQAAVQWRQGGAAAGQCQRRACALQGGGGWGPHLAPLCLFEAVQAQHQRPVHIRAAVEAARVRAGGRGRAGRASTGAGALTPAPPMQTVPFIQVRGWFAERAAPDGIPHTTLSSPREAAARGLRGSRAPALPHGASWGRWRAAPTSPPSSRRLTQEHGAATTLGPRTPPPPSRLTRTIGTPAACRGSSGRPSAPAPAPGLRRFKNSPGAGTGGGGGGGPGGGVVRRRGSG
jgi:hypothetical protein